MVGAPSTCRYLHARDPPIIHRDLKSANLLVETDWGVKVADFGTSAVVELHKEMTLGTRGVVGDALAGYRDASKGTGRGRKKKGGGGGDSSTPLLTANQFAGSDNRHLHHSAGMTSDVGTLEWMAPELHERKAYGPKVDVFAFSICLWEIITRHSPWMHLESGPGLAEVIRKRVLGGDRLSIPDFVAAR